MYTVHGLSEGLKLPSIMGEIVLINGPEVVTSYSVELVPLFRYEVDVPMMENALIALFMSLTSLGCEHVNCRGCMGFGSVVPTKQKMVSDVGREQWIQLRTIFIQARQMCVHLKRSSRGHRVQQGCRGPSMPCYGQPHADHDHEMH